MLVKRSCGHHGQLGPNTEESRVLSRPTLHLVTSADHPTWGVHVGKTATESHTLNSTLTPSNLYWSPTFCGPRGPILSHAHTVPSSWKALPLTACGKHTPTCNPWAPWPVSEGRLLNAAHRSWKVRKKEDGKIGWEEGRERKEKMEGERGKKGKGFIYHSFECTYYCSSQLLSKESLIRNVNISRIILNI